MNAQTVHPLVGKPAPAPLLVDVPRLLAAYYMEHPEPSVPEQRVAFGTSGLVAWMLEGQPTDTPDQEQE